jgi:hypothetical protein
MFPSIVQRICKHASIHSGSFKAWCKACFGSILSGNNCVSMPHRLLGHLHLSSWYENCAGNFSTAIFWFPAGVILLLHPVICLYIAGPITRTQELQGLWVRAKGINHMDPLQLGRALGVLVGVRHGGKLVWKCNLGSWGPWQFSQGQKTGPYVG